MDAKVIVIASALQALIRKSNITKLLESLYKPNLFSDQSDCMPIILNQILINTWAYHNILKGIQRATCLYSKRLRNTKRTF